MDGYPCFIYINLQLSMLLWIHLDIIGFLWISMPWLAMDSRCRDTSKSSGSHPLLYIKMSTGIHDSRLSSDGKTLPSRWSGDDQNQLLGRKFRFVLYLSKRFARLVLPLSTGTLWTAKTSCDASMPWYLRPWLKNVIRHESLFSYGPCNLVRNVPYILVYLLRLWRRFTSPAFLKGVGNIRDRLGNIVKHWSSAFERAYPAKVDHC